MPQTQETILRQLSDAVVAMDEEQTVILAKAAIESGIEAFEAIDKGLSDGMTRAGRLYEDEEYFIPELLMCSDAMYAGLEVLKPHLARDGGAPAAKVVIGVIEGDTHDIGKNIVKMMLETAGYQVLDLGRDVPAQKFVDTARKEAAALIAVATLMSTTMDGMAEVIRLLNRENIRADYKVMVGGAPVSQAYADRIGADAYAVNAAEAVRLAKTLIGG